MSIYSTFQFSSKSFWILQSCQGWKFLHQRGAFLKIRFSCYAAIFARNNISGINFSNFSSINTDNSKKVVQVYHNYYFQQLTKVGLPINVVSGVNPLSNGIINPAGNLLFFIIFLSIFMVTIISKVLIVLFLFSFKYVMLFGWCNLRLKALCMNWSISIQSK